MRLLGQAGDSLYHAINSALEQPIVPPDLPVQQTELRSNVICQATQLPTV